MALTITEQLNILEGVTKPTDASVTFNLEALVRQVAVNEAQNFYTNAENPNAETHGEAFDYVSKMYTVCNNIFVSTRSTIFTAFSKILIAVYADNGVIATVEAADTAAWVAFLENNMLKTLELYAGVKAFEKTAYDALP